MHSFLEDLKYAARLLRRSPGWTAVAVLSLALGIGANAVVFSLVNAVLLEPFPYRDTGQLVLLWGSRAEDQRTGISGADLADWRADSRAFEDIDAFLGGNMKFSLGPSETDRIAGACMGHRVPSILGVQPLMGRPFTADEAKFGAAPVVIVSDALWQSRLGADPNVVGRTLRIDDRIHEIVGVMPPGFFFPDTDARLWVPSPCGLGHFDERGSMTLNAIGRLRSGVSVADAQADIDRIDAALAQAYPTTNRRRTTGVFPLRHIVIGKYERALWTLVWAIALVLLIACVNVAHLQLARGVDREIELAVRAAAGARRARLVRQLLTESALLVAIATIAAVFVAWFGLRLIHAFALSDVARMESARIDARVLGFTFIASLATALLSGLWPAVKTSAVRISETLKLGASATAGKAQSQFRDLLAMLEIAAAVTLLVASGLVVKSFVQLSRAEWGFTPDHLLLMDLELPRATGATNRAVRREIAEAIRARLTSLPDVTHVAVGPNAPIRWGGWSPRPVAVDGQIRSDLTAGVWNVDRDYFATAGIPVFEGREFSEVDDQRAPLKAVSSRSLAQILWPGQSAVGKKLQILTMKAVPPDQQRALLQRFSTVVRGWPNDPSLYDASARTDFEVIGVVGDVRMFGLGGRDNPALYLEGRQLDWSLGARLKVLVRTNGDPMSIVPAAKAQISGVSRDVRFTEIVPVADLVAQSIGGRGSNKLLLIVATAFGILALAFATIGIYGVVAHNVSQRLREIGIRVALGATRRDTARMVGGYALRLMASGLALGITAAWAATRGMRALLFATTPTDPFTYGLVIVVLSAAAVLACVPSLRTALRFDPVVLFKA